jgi:hypothetical protein
MPKTFALLLSTLSLSLAATAARAGTLTFQCAYSIDRPAKKAVDTTTGRSVKLVGKLPDQSDCKADFKRIAGKECQMGAIACTTTTKLGGNWVGLHCKSSSPNCQDAVKLECPKEAAKVGFSWCRQVKDGGKAPPGMPSQPDLRFSCSTVEVSNLRDCYGQMLALLSKNGCQPSATGCAATPQKPQNTWDCGAKSKRCYTARDGMCDPNKEVASGHYGPTCKRR